MSLAAVLKQELGVEAELERGRISQFDVLVGGDVVATRSGGLLTRLLGGGWPDPSEVVMAVAARLKAPA